MGAEQISHHKCERNPGLSEGQVDVPHSLNWVIELKSGSVI
jgi:hypothetical protein